MASPAVPAAHAQPEAPRRWRPSWSMRSPLAPGLLLAGVVALAATHAAQYQGGSPLIYALLLGLALNWAAEHPRALPGLAWSAGPLLRIGVGLLGARLAASQLLALGATTLGTMAAAMASTLLLGLLGARLMRLPWQVGLLAGGANAVCGASATLALAAVLPRQRDDEDNPLPRHALVIAACATTMSTAAMLGYPWLAHALGLHGVHAGIFLGGSIQDVAQVVAAGYTVGPQAGDTAVSLKLARVAMLGPLVALVAWAARYAGRAGVASSAEARPARAPMVPPFVWLFFVLMAANSVGWMPAPLQRGLGDLSQACVTVAVAALGMRLSFRELARAGWRPFVLMALLAAWIAGVMAVGAGRES